ncbi:MAG: S46 family peptidase [Planctomycetota bacterium]
MNLEQNKGVPKPFSWAGRLSISFVAALLAVGFAGRYSAHAEEGMHPVSEIAALNLNEKGLEMDVEDVFNPDRVCLIDGICKVNGCTGSFVSGDGLIITNHHCAYRAIQSASTADNDLLENGFIAGNREEEIQAMGYTVRVTESFSDVSEAVLSVVDEGMSFIDRTNAIDRQRKEIEKAAEEENPGMRAEVAEMFIGKTYYLFLYTYLTDIRLVFAPPSSVGNFGGEVDNWEWPRHTGDFAFVRAYVAPDGSSADYSPDNVPYQPKRFIQVAPQGVNEGDFVMLLGYPGRTSRHKTASFLDYEENVRLPWVVDMYNWEIEALTEAGRIDREIELKHSSRIKGLANVEKRSRGQLKGLRSKRIAEMRAAAERELQSFIDSNPELKEQYGDVLSEIDAVYAEMTALAEYELNMNNLDACQLFRFAFTVYDAAVERQKEDLDRETAFMDRNWDQTTRRLMLAHQDLHLPTDQMIFMGMQQRILSAASLSRPEYDPSAVSVMELVTSTPAERIFNGSRLGEREILEQCLTATPAELEAMDDAAIQFAISLYPEFKRLRELNKERAGRLNQLYGDLITVKMEFMKTAFVPDANATLRLTFGSIKRFSPEDAVIKTPITTLGGVVAKTTGESPFVTPQRILDMHAAGDFGPYAHPEMNDVPTCILYDTDTTGGNSGSPILNGRGELVGVNFDRAFEATINDFAWNHDYSRSLGVDVRYVLWITDKVYGASHLIEEMGISRE